MPTLQTPSWGPGSASVVHLVADRLDDESAHAGDYRAADGLATDFRSFGDMCMWGVKTYGRKWGRPTPPGGEAQHQHRPGGGDKPQSASRHLSSARLSTRRAADLQRKNPWRLTSRGGEPARRSLAPGDDFSPILRRPRTARPGQAL